MYAATGRVEPGYGIVSRGFNLSGEFVQGRYVIVG